MPLPWAPKSLLSDTEGWSFTNSANRAMSDLATMGERLMQPVGQQVRSVVEQAMPAPIRPEPDPQLTPQVTRQATPAIPRFSLGRVEDWLTPATAPQPAPQLAQPAPPTMPVPAAAPQQSGMFSLPSLESYLGRGSTAAPTTSPVPAPSEARGTGAAGAPPAAGGDLREYARAVAGRYGVDPGVFERQIAQESGFNPKAVSPAGAQGIAQFMPATAKGVGLADPFEPYSALDAAARHMRDNLDRNGGDYARALAAYNAGQGAVDTHGGVPPFAETRKYVRTILGDERPKAGPSPSLTPGPTSANPQASAGLDVGGITEAYKGVPYTFGGPGGRGQGVGATTDCSGFVAAVWKNQYGLDLPAHTDTSYNALRKLGAPEVSAADARPGDVVYYMGAGTGGAIAHHMGIFAGPGKVLDMSTSGTSGAAVRDLGHAGRYVILRDPRVNQQAPERSQAPPPIVPTGIAERTGGEAMRTVQARTPAAAPQARPEPLTAATSAPSEPMYDPREADEGPHEGANGAVAQAFRHVNGFLPSAEQLSALVSRVYGG